MQQIRLISPPSKRSRDLHQSQEQPLESGWTVPLNGDAPVIFRATAYP